MAKVHLDRLKKKYGWTGGRYQKLVEMIMGENSQSISNRIGELTNRHFDEARGKLPKDRQARFVVPDVSEVLPKRSVFVRKGAEKGKLLTDTLRDGLTRRLRRTLSEFTPGTGEQAFISRRGRTAGRTNPKLIEQFERGITEEFDNYTKRDPSYGVPEQVHNIAVTEVRSASDEIKFSYTRRMVEKNPDIDAYKVWIHNDRLVDQPRTWHQDADGQRVKLDKPFRLENPETGVVYMMHPHAPGAPPGEVIGCQCDFDIFLEVPKRGSPGRVARSAQGAIMGEGEEHAR